uniref:Uncharacterized protein n=1 Tax=Arundo donax TaxID=35708 RepID=A0A0A9A0I9_ARUDO
MKFNRQFQSDQNGRNMKFVVNFKVIKIEDT